MQTDHCVKCADDHYANTKRDCQQPPSTKAVIFLVFDLGGVGVNNQSLSSILLISRTQCLLCSLLFTGPQHSHLHPLAIHISCVFTIDLSIILTKTITVVMAFRFNTPGRKVRYGSVSQSL